MTRPPIASEIPTLNVEIAQARHNVHRAIELLAESNDPPRLFVRGGRLARFRVDENGRPLVEPFARPADDAALRVELDARIEFGRQTKPKKDADPTWKSLPAPREIVGGVRTDGQWPGIPPLEAVTEAPTIRADGEIIDEPGYDEPSRLLYHPGPYLHVPAIPRRPPRDQVTAAVAALDDVLCDFPFASPASHANALALLLTPLVRPAIDGPVPLALVSGTKAGTGKGLLIEIASRIATGRGAGLTPVPATDEEMAKVIGSLLLAGANFIAFDEVDELRSGALASALTARVVKPRILGESTMAELPQRATWVAAGNNIRLRGDLVRRCYWIELDAKVARPYERTGFRHPELVAHVSERRAELIAAALTIARAWYAADRPAADVPTLGGFEQWAKTLGGILAHAGIDGFLADQHAKHRAADHDSAEWERFLAAISALYREDTFTVGDLLGHLRDGNGLLTDAAPDDLIANVQGATLGSGRSRLGKALRDRKNTRFGDAGYHLVATEETARNGTRWTVYTDAEVSEVAEVLPLTTRARGRAGAGTARGKTSETSKPLHSESAATETAS